MTKFGSATLSPTTAAARVFFFSVALLIAAPARAQNFPADTSNVDALEQRRAQEREAALRRQQEREGFVRLPATVDSSSAVLPADERPCFPIQQLTLRGPDAAQFSWLTQVVAERRDAQPSWPRCLGVRGVGLIIKRAQDALVAQGYVTSRVLAEPQDLRTGTLALTLVTGRIRSIRFAEPASVRATSWNAFPVHPGDVLNLRDIEQALENFKRVPSADAKISIAPGDEPGQSDLVVDWAQGNPFRLQAAVDDGGSRATGKYQGNVTISFDHWWTLNDLFYADIRHDLGGGSAQALGTRGATLHYSVPLGNWSLGATASANKFAQNVAGASQTYAYSGMSRNLELKLGRTLHRDGTSKTTGNLQAFARSSRNNIDDTEVEVQRRRVGGWALGFNHRLALARDSAEFGLEYRRGTGAFGSLPAPEQAFGEGTSRFSVLTGQASVSHPFAWAARDWHYSGQASLQINRTPLTPQDRFSIGGRNSVRGFDGESTLSADRGWLLRNELATALGDTGQQFFMGLDYGMVAGPSSALLAGHHLTGAAMGLRGALGSFSYEAFVGVPLSKPASFQTAGVAYGIRLTFNSHANAASPLTPTAQQPGALGRP